MAESLHYPFLLLTHVICADGQIHSEEAKALHALANQIEINEATQAEVDKILSQDSDHIHLEEVAINIPPKARIESLRQVLAVAYVDGYFDPLEKSLVDQLTQLWSIDQFEVTQMLETAQGFLQGQTSEDTSQELSQLSTGAKLLQGAQSLLSQSLVNKLAALAPRQVGQEIERLQREILLSGPEYGQAIGKCTQIAQEDLEYAQRALQNSFKSLKTLGTFLHHGIQNIERKTAQQGRHQSAQEAVQQVNQTRKHLESKLLEDLETVKRALHSKQRALRYFTIAFMGRTKAGKSTLHSIITNQGWESIGVGKQRTTRYNRIYEWNNIRIIDTPGIGAPGGKTDEEIAASVAAEADIICYVVTNDSIQESEFSFLRSLKEKAKPVIILLNIQINLRDSRRLERFLSNPDRHFDMDGNSGIGGHFKRIKRYAQQHYANEHLPIIPVMLLAAQMSKEADHSAIAQKLFKASRIQDFLDSLRISIIDDGPIRRSQTLLGSTVGEIQQPSVWIKKQADAYRQLTNQLAAKQQGLAQTLQGCQKRTWQGSENSIKEVFQGLRAKAEKFAEQHWQDSSSELSEAWATLLKDIKLESRIENIVKTAADKFQQDVQTEIEEIGKELQILNKLYSKSFRFSQQDQGFLNFDKGFVRNVGIALSLAGLITAFVFPPLGILTVIGGVISWAAGFMQSKEEKRSRAVASIRQFLNAQIDEQQQSVLPQAKSNFDQYCKSIIRSVDVYFKELGQGVEAIADKLAKTGQELDDATNYLNRAYAKRIVDWSVNSSTSLTDVSINKAIRKVSREFGSTISIVTTTPLGLDKSEEEMSEILQEKVSILPRKS